MAQRRFYGLVIILCLFAGITHGQALAPSFGVKMGITSSTISFDKVRGDLFNPNINQVAKRGFVGGVMFRHFLQPHAGLQIELNLIQKGWSEEIADGVFFNTTLQYIELPFMMNIYLGKKKTKYFFNLGPNVGYLLSSSEGAFDPSLEEGIKYRVSQDKPNKVSAGISAGIGINRTTSFGQLQFDFRFNLAFTNVFEMVRIEQPENSQIQVMGLSVAYLWNLNNPTKKAHP